MALSKAQRGPGGDCGRERRYEELRVTFALVERLCLPQNYLLAECA